MDIVMKITMIRMPAPPIEDHIVGCIHSGLTEVVVGSTRSSRSSENSFVGDVKLMCFVVNFSILLSSTWKFPIIGDL